MLSPRPRPPSTVRDVNRRPMVHQGGSLAAILWVITAMTGCGNGSEADGMPGGSVGTVTTEPGSTSGGTAVTSATESTGPDQSSTVSTTDGTGTATDTSPSTTGAVDCDPRELCRDATQAGQCRRELELPDGRRFYYWSNLPLDPAPSQAGCHAGVVRAIFVQHGNSRNPWSYFNTMRQAATTAGVEEETLIVAPYFPSDADDAPEDFHRWDPGTSGWKSGDDSVTLPPLSSFSVYDHMLFEYVFDRSIYPELHDVVITGHSAGGQFSQRFAVATDIDEAAPQGLSFRYIILNPSSYLYLDAYRWDGVGTPPGVSFQIPSGSGCDNTYDDFKYGLSNLPAGHYVTKHSASIPASFLGRDVTYLLGEADTEVDSDLDTSCPAKLQGGHRLQRGLVFRDHLDARFPGQSHGLALVPGVGHSQSGMYGSDVGRSVLFP